MYEITLYCKYDFIHRGNVVSANIRNLLHRINYLTAELDGLYHQAALGVGLADSTMLVLYTIYDNGGSCLLRTIYQQPGISKQTVNSAIRKLKATTFSI